MVCAETLPAVCVATEREELLVERNVIVTCGIGK